MFPPPFSHIKNPVSNKSPSLAPKYEELAAMYTPSHSSQVTIAKVDATANDVPDEISGFPTIKLFPAGAKSEPIVYSGSRTIEDLAAFVKENGKYKVDVMEGKNETAEAEMPDADAMGKQAPAATKVAQKVMSGASEAAEAVKTAVGDSDHDGAEHDEL
jgi:protein disulfide-isomerase A1